MRDEKLLIRARAATAMDVALRRVGVRRIDRRPPDMETEFLEAYQRCEPYTMTSIERMYSLWQAVRYAVTREVPGDYVECGVWRGGSSMLASLAFRETNDHGRVMHLYDTFEGMSEPGAEDGLAARREWLHHQQRDHNAWCYSPLEEVRENMLSTGLPEHRLRLIKGTVEETVPSQAPERIAVLRLDTDWYESTKHELVHLYPLLHPGGVLIVDDYGFWRGARKAVDEYFAENSNQPLLIRVDSTGRIAVKP